MEAKKVSNLDLQRKSARIIVGVNGLLNGKVVSFLPKDFNLLNSLEILSSDGFRYYAIIHDKDKTEYKHIHLVLVSSKTLRFKQFVNSVSNAFNCSTDNVSIRETTNLISNIQYLVHKNETNANKFHYPYECLFSNDTTENVLSILQDDNNTYDDLVSTESLFDIVRLSSNRANIIIKLGYKFYNSNYRVINDLIKIYHYDWLENGR